MKDNSRKTEYSKIIVLLIIVFCMVYLAQNAVLMFMTQSYDPTVASALVVCLSITVATYNWRAQAADTYRFQAQWLAFYSDIKTKNPEIDLSDFQQLNMPENISHN